VTAAAANLGNGLRLPTRLLAMPESPTTARRSLKTLGNLCSLHHQHHHHHHLVQKRRRRRRKWWCVDQAPLAGTVCQLWLGLFFLLQKFHAEIRYRPDHPRMITCARCDSSGRSPHAPRASGSRTHNFGRGSNLPRLLPPSLNHARIYCMIIYERQGRAASAGHDDRESAV
jgi:hypothetical protein